jgi:hypothetical protein
MEEGVAQAVSERASAPVVASRRPRA